MTGKNAVPGTSTAVPGTCNRDSEEPDSEGKEGKECAVTESSCGRKKSG